MGFSCACTPGFPDLLRAAGGTLAVTTYQTGHVLLLAPDGDGLAVTRTRVPRAMGLAADDRRLAVAGRREVAVYGRVPAPPPPHDALFARRATYHTGPLDLHDLAYGTHDLANGTHDGQPVLWGVATRFSCVAVLDDTASFRPVWQPPFVTRLAPEDRCHLNGLALREGRPAFATALGPTDTRRGWRPGKLTDGVVLDVSTGAVVLADLPMPHAPRWADGALWFLAAATGELRRVDLAAGRSETVARLPALVRGLAACGDVLFVGGSRLRAGKTFGDLPLAAHTDLFAGVAAVHVRTGAVLGTVQFGPPIHELYDVQMLPGVLRPAFVRPEAARHPVPTPTATFWTRRDEVPPAPAGRP